MRQLFFALGLLFIIGLVVQACSSEPKSTTIAQDKKADSLAACSTIKDPNQTKPMALMMRQMAANADSMKTKINRGQVLDSLQYPFIRFYIAEPTDPSVLEPNFFEKSRLFQSAYRALFQHPKEQKKYYNLMIQACVNCHENYCSGPLKRIRKLPIQ
jgi:hypothetical protein